MEWVPCEELDGSLGSREGHCAVCLPVSGTTDEEWVLCLGGYCEGELSGDIIASNASKLPTLSWVTLLSAEWVECDGASLTRIGPVAYLFGGFNAEMERTNSLIRLALRTDSGDASLLLEAEDVLTAGDVPPPRSRHSAGGSASSGEDFLLLFGGETDDAEQVNEMFKLDLRTLFWTRIEGIKGPVPTPRLLAGEIVFISPDVCVLYGGAHFVAGDILSLQDVWVFRLSLRDWTQLQDIKATPTVTTATIFPRSNGHVGGSLYRGQKKIAFFLGGKDAMEGCDKVKCIGWSDNNEDRFECSVVEPYVRVTDGVAPHWRYTPALATTKQGLILLGGQCRHPQDVAVFLLRPTGKH